MLVVGSRGQRGGGAKFCPRAGGISGLNQILSVLRVFFDTTGPDLGTVDPKVTQVRLMAVNTNVPLEKVPSETLPAPRDAEATVAQYA